MEWILPEQNNAPLIEWIFSSRNIDPNNSSFFNPQLSDLHSPLLLSDVKKVAVIIKEFLGTDRKIFIHGDFDVDGITATSIMWQFLFRDLGLNALPYIPSRFTEGYGLSEESINRIIEMGGELIITVDCGVKDASLIKEFSNKIKFIVTDHHTLLSDQEKVEGGKLAGEYLIPDKALAVCHPKLNNYPFRELCGAAVSWKVCSAVNEILKKDIDMTKYLDLVAIGTVCDIMPLIDENRTLVKLGLEKLKRTSNLGIRNIFDYLKIPLNSIDTYHLGFVLGPRINATGRLEDAMDGVRLLTTQDHKMALKMALKLDSLNSERQLLTQKFIELAEEQIQSQINDNLFFIYGDGWPEGIIGLIAGKICEKYHRPVIVGSLKDGRIKASARSIESFNIAQNLSDLSALLLSHGGHTQAAGLSFAKDNLDKFVPAIKNAANSIISQADLIKKLRIDGLATLADINLDTHNKLSSLSPFGMANKKPVMALRNVSADQLRVFGKENNHIKFIFNTDNGPTEALGFYKAQELENFGIGNKIDIAGTIEKNDWNGTQSTYIKIDDIKHS